MRTLLAACLLIAAAPLAHAGVLVKFTDGTTLTVESHWNDGEQVHLVRGGVDMIVAKSRIKAIDEDVADPEVYRGGGSGEAEATADGAAQAAPAGGEPAAQPQTAGDPDLSAMSAEELEALQHEEASRLLDLQEKSFNALHGGKATPDQQKQADDAFAEQNRRTVQVRGALEKAKKADGGVPTVPRVEQPQ